MTDHLPAVYVDFRKSFPEVAAAHDQVAATIDARGVLDDRTTRLVKLGIAIGGLHEGAVRSSVRKALAAGATRDEIEQVVLLALTTSGFPSLVAAWGWVREVLDAG